MNFTINNDIFDFDPRLYEHHFQKIVDYLVLKLKLNKDRFFECSFVSQEEMQEINNNYRGKNYVTDVISFAFDDEGMITPLLGEMFICVDKAKSQAIEYGHSFEREICFLFVHGLLHLLGFDHQTKEDEEEMFGLQNETLNKIGVVR